MWGLTQRVMVGILREISAADGAGGVGREPGVDALRVEHVVALGEEPEGLLLVELVQADGALQRALPDFQVLDLGVAEGGEGVDQGGVEAAGGSVSPGAVGAGGAAADGGPDADGEDADE
uniref:Uncharacterized protein n=1 Tax=Kalanchoe fedtschenkoi TaxID=63787 RepID=A0A7N0SXZ3_KALFE